MSMFERIRVYINGSGLKMNHIAEKSNIESKRFYRIINGSSTMSADEFEAICAALNVEPKYFFEQNVLDTKKIGA